MDDYDKQIGDGADKQIADPISPELEITTDTVPAQSLDRDKQIDCGNEMEVGAGESQMSSTKSRKRKHYEPSSSDEDEDDICTCPPSPLPEGYGYVPSAPWRDKNGKYIPGFTKVVRYMNCKRCGIDGDHFPQFCTNPVNDRPNSASHPLSWKSLLGDFDAKKYLEEQKAKAKSGVPRECAHCQNLSAAETAETDELPEGYGYVPSAPWRDKNGDYVPGFTNVVRYMSCDRCGIDGDHFPQFCTNPVNDPPNSASCPVSWKNLLGNFDAKKYLEDQRLGLKEKPKRSWFTQGKEIPKRRRFMGLGFS